MQEATRCLKVNKLTASPTRLNAQVPEVPLADCCRVDRYGFISYSPLSAKTYFSHTRLY